MTASRHVFAACIGGMIGAALVAVPFLLGRASVHGTITFSGPSEERDSIVAFEARRIGMDPSLAIAVSHVENWSGDSAAVHPRTKATGLMQVMPFWDDSLLVECYGPVGLMNRSRNACLGTRIAWRYFMECGNWNCALVWYVGAKCTPRDTPERCARKTKAGETYVLDVVERFARPDLSPARDAMARGEYRTAPVVNSGSGRPAQSLRLDPNSVGADTAWRRAVIPAAPLFAKVQS